MSIITSNYRKIKEQLPPHVKLIVVSKNQEVEAIQTLYESGCRIFGENRVQELISKFELLPKDIEWHLVGHLQTNKVKYIAPFVTLIHSIDSLKLLNEINLYAIKNSRVIDCLLQFHIATEETKFGLNAEEVDMILKSDDYTRMENIRIVGVMGMASFSDDIHRVRSEFKALKNIFDHLKHQYFNLNDRFCEISMGMSGDYQLAIEEGSTMVRIGTAIFSNSGSK